MADYIDMRTARVEVIRKHCRQIPFDELFDLIQNSNGIVSKNYSERCLHVDLWHLQRRSIFHAKYINIRIIDPDSALFLRVIIQSLIDYGNGRPCDLGMWRLDCPPGNKGVKCCPENHICKNQAKLYLSSITPSQEVFAGLTPGTVRGYMDKFDTEATYEYP